MELHVKYLVAIILAVVVLLALVSLLTQSIPVEDVELHAKYQKGCQILARNGCDFNFEVDGMEFREILEELGMREEDVRKACCTT